MHKRQGYLYGQAVIALLIFMLNYTYFYHHRFGLLKGAEAEWSSALLLSLSAVLAGLFIELGRYWGAPLEVKINQDLLLLQGIPAAVLGIVPDPLWIQLGGSAFPYIFFADPVVSGIAGVWLGIVLLRSIFSPKKMKDEEEEKEREQSKKRPQSPQRYSDGI